MSEAFSTAPVLHIWPPHDSALSFDPMSVAALLHLQLAIPGRYTVAYTANPDISPSGQLPYLTHGLHSVSTLPAIAKYAANWAGASDIDGSLTSVEKAQLYARTAHVQSDYGDLVAHMLYSLQLNWWKLTRPTLVSMLPVPQRYYVPGRIREMYKSRLEAAELWDIPGTEEEAEEDNLSVFRKEKKQKRPSKAQKLARAFKREQVLDRARVFFSSYEKLLGNNVFFHSHSERPTSLDIVFAAHTHILISLPFADTLIQSLLLGSYPTLVAHAKAVQSFAVPDSSAFPSATQFSLASSVQSLFPRSVFSWGRRRKGLGDKEDKEDRRYAMARWGWGALAVAGLAVYWQLFGLGPGIQISFVSNDTEEVIDEDDEDLLEDLEDEDEEVEEVDDDES